LLLEGRTFHSVNNTNRYPLSPLLSFYQGSKLVAWVVVITKLVNSFLVPAVGVLVVKRDTGLKNINEGESLMLKALLD
jgi:hypothetical protein